MHMQISLIAHPKYEAADPSFLSADEKEKVKVKQKATLLTTPTTTTINSRKIETITSYIGGRETVTQRETDRSV